MSILTAENKTLGEFVAEAAHIEFSKDYFNLVKECSELDLLMLYAEAYDYVVENVDDLTDADFETLVINESAFVDVSDDMEAFEEGKKAPAKKKEEPAKEERLDLKAYANSDGNEGGAIAHAKNEGTPGKGPGLKQKIKNVVEQPGGRSDRNDPLATKTEEKKAGVFKTIWEWIKKVCRAIKTAFISFGKFITGKSADMEKLAEATKAALQALDENTTVGTITLPEKPKGLNISCDAPSATGTIGDFLALVTKTKVENGKELAGRIATDGKFTMPAYFNGTLKKYIDAIDALLQAMEEYSGVAEKGTPKSVQGPLTACVTAGNAIGEDLSKTEKGIKITSDGLKALSEGLAGKAASIEKRIAAVEKKGNIPAAITKISESVMKFHKVSADAIKQLSLWKKDQTNCIQVAYNFAVSIGGKPGKKAEDKAEDKKEEAKD